jgi:hypothetical protein
MQPRRTNVKGLGSRPSGWEALTSDPPQPVSIDCPVDAGVRWGGRGLP